MALVSDPGGEPETDVDRAMKMLTEKRARVRKAGLYFNHQVVHVAECGYGSLQGRNLISPLDFNGRSLNHDCDIHSRYLESG